MSDAACLRHVDVRERGVDVDAGLLEIAQGERRAVEVGFGFDLDAWTHGALALRRPPMQVVLDHAGLLRNCRITGLQERLQKVKTSAIQKGAKGESEPRNAAACRVKDSWNWKRDPCPESG